MNSLVTLSQLLKPSLIYILVNKAEMRKANYGHMSFRSSATSALTLSVIPLQKLHVCVRCVRSLTIGTGTALHPSSTNTAKGFTPSIHFNMPNTY